ncbi:MAG: hypothetical protein WCA26_18255, partial [Xanthobacteraceae bacterium]
MKLQNLRNAALGIPSGSIDRDTHEIISGAVDQIAVVVELKIAGSGEIGDAGKDRLVIGEACRLG